jgi:hypothetical protein
VTDPTVPTLDPVERRLRRTFAARAEDMAPGDTNEDLPDLGPVGRAPSRLHARRNRVLVAAAAAVVVALVSAGLVAVARGGDDYGGVAATGEQDQPGGSVGLVTAPSAVVLALQNERTVATSWLLGIEDALEMPVADNGQARHDTDAAIADLETFAASPDRAAYRPALDALGALEELRSEIDAQAGARSLANSDVAGDVFARYAALVGGVLDGQKAVVDGIDDPVVRTGGTAYWRGLQIEEQTLHFVRATLLDVVDPSADSDSARDRLDAQVQLQLSLDALLAETAGTPYAEAATSALEEIDYAALLEAGGVPGEPIDLSTFLDGAPRPGGAWSSFLDRVEEILAAAT